MILCLHRILGCLLPESYGRAGKCHQHTKDLQNESKALISDHIITADCNVSEPRMTPSSGMWHVVLRSSETLQSAVTIWLLIKLWTCLGDPWCAGDIFLLWLDTLPCVYAIYTHARTCIYVKVALYVTKYVLWACFQFQTYCIKMFS